MVTFNLRQHLEDRKFIIRSLRESVCGPKPSGTAREMPSHIDDWSELPFRQQNGEEVLDDSPLLRYGVGVLYPPETDAEREDDSDSSSPFGANDGDSNPVDIHTASTVGDADDSDFDIAAVNKLKQSSLGISYYVNVENISLMRVVIPQRARLLPGDEELIPVNGIYRARQIQVGSQQFQKDFWSRMPLQDEDIIIDVNIDRLQTNGVFCSLISSADGKTCLELKVYSRRPCCDEENHKIITVCLINKSVSNNQMKMAEQCLFQTYFRVEVENAVGGGGIKPYPCYKSAYDNEERSLDLLYRKRQTFGIGHGCSADWIRDAHDGEHISSISAEVLPLFEDKSLTPNITDEEGNPLRIPVIDLINDSGITVLRRLHELYGTWIEKQEEICSRLETRERQETLRRHIQECFKCLNRIEQGISWLESDHKALQAFQLANKAMAMQKFLGNRGQARKVSRGRNGVVRVEGDCGYTQLSELPEEQLRGWCWRPFQIAFILMSLRSSVDGTDEHRDNVELIWFPTGGGKTEAYLGLAAFSLFYRRLQGKSDIGTHVLMRYTLRLLTTQQFQRASRLVCAMELVRHEQIEQLGDTPFSIGIWVGGGNTPNTRQAARNQMRDMQRYPNKKNCFVHECCPWCGASFKYSERVHNAQFPGYTQHGKTVVFSCPDQKCPFHGAGNLPIYVVDEDIYESRPDIIIGTVDKFAQLIWKQEVRFLFGIDGDGHRFASPPGLIIQDELHLISGPLGSMCGLFETIIEDLCTDRRGEDRIPPKIICSTATIRRFEEQVRNLFARDHVTLFPPPGNDCDDSFFAVTDKYENGQNKPGRIYVGINAPGYSSLTFAQVVAYSGLLHAAKKVSTDPLRQDPWWTLLTFFNSLRELGTVLTLFQTDILDYSAILRRQTGEEIRYLRCVEELTSRLSNEEIPRVLTKLETAQPDKGVIDACLASSIIEVGIDVGRLCMMSIVGQPKTTSQYIQVSGRVGRIKPGVVFTFYSPSKPRDRSHYERFRSYHEKLYAQVEPTSVTPFAPPVLSRSIHAALIAGIRQLGAETQIKHPSEIPGSLVLRVSDLLRKRADTLLEVEDMDHFNVMLDRRVRELKSFGKEKWVNYSTPGSDAVLRFAGEYVSPEFEFNSWPTQTSMRNVDATCQAAITKYYLDAANSEKNGGQ